MTKLFFTLTLLCLTFGIAWGGAFVNPYGAFDTNGFEDKQKVFVAADKASGFNNGAEVVRILRPLANSGDTIALFQIADAYSDPDMGILDYKEAMRWYKLTSDQGIGKNEFIKLVGQSRHTIGGMYKRGLGVAKDYREAVKWYRLALDQQFWGARYDLGLIYYSGGNGVAQDYAEAMSWFKQATMLGHSGAQNKLGDMYDRGLGVPQDYKEALRWYKLAADPRDAGTRDTDTQFNLGDIDAQYALGDMYYNGRGVLQDYKEAVKWWRLAAENGDATAQASLGFMYAKGMGVLQDYARAHMWWNIASAAGDANGTKNRDIIAKKMTPQQIEKAQEMAKACQARNFKGC